MGATITLLWPALMGFGVVTTTIGWRCREDDDEGDRLACGCCGKWSPTARYPFLSAI